MKQIIVAAFVLSIFSSCVSKKKFDDVLAQKVRMEADLADRNTQIDKANTDLKNLNERLRQLREDSTNISIDVRNSANGLRSWKRSTVSSTARIRTW
jgi:septal ring factor EnvC (AmiA/AmiB activator)